MLNLSHVRFKKLRVYASLAMAPILMMGAATLCNPFPLLAQTEASKATFTLPDTVAAGTTVRVDGSSSLKTINNALKQQFERQFKSTKVEVNEAGSEAALESLLKGQVDLVAMGRSLTADEKAQGLVEVPLSRHKIAIIVGSDNPFSEDLKIEQFAKIFRGEIKDWSELGAPAGAIRFVDRPELSDTRQAFQNYPIFQSAPFQTGTTATAVNEDQTDAVVKSLGKDGISYAIVDQVTDRSDVKILSMHKVMPTDAKYPFSQPLSYVYKGPEPNPAVQAFLGYATAPENQALVEAARLSGVSAATNGAAATSESPEKPAVDKPPADSGKDAGESAAVPGNTGSDADGADAAASGEVGGFRWWPWLLLPLLAGGLWWLLGRGAGPVAAPIAAAGSDKSRLILTPRNCQTAYAYWELCDRDQKRLNESPNRPLSLRLYEDRAGNQVSGSSRHLVQQVNCAVNGQDHHFNIPLDDKDYFVELGYERDGQWTALERSETVRVPACNLSTGAFTQATSAAAATGVRTAPVMGTTAVGTVAAGAAGVAGAAVLGDREQMLGNRTVSEQTSTYDKIILVPRKNQDAYAYWEVAPSSKQALRDLGGQSLKLRIHDVTNIDMDIQPPISTQEYDCDEFNQDRHVVIPSNNRDYIADLGYETLDKRWLRLVRSLSVRI